MLVKSHSPKFKAVVARPGLSEPGLRQQPASIPRLSGAVATRGISSCFTDDELFSANKSRSASVAPPKTRRRSSTRANLPSTHRNTIHHLADSPPPKHFHLEHRHTTDKRTDSVSKSAQTDRTHHYIAENRPHHSAADRPHNYTADRQPHHYSPLADHKTPQPRPAVIARRSSVSEEFHHATPEDCHHATPVIVQTTTELRTTQEPVDARRVRLCSEGVLEAHTDPPGGSEKEPEVTKSEAVPDSGPSRVTSTQIPATSASSCSTSLAETPADEQVTLADSSEVTRHVAMTFGARSSAKAGPQPKFVPPLACLAPTSVLGRRVCVCRTPTRLAEPVGNVRFEQPTLEQVKRALKILTTSVPRAHGSEANWVIWELSSKRESIVQQMAPDFRHQMLPYRINDAGLLPLSLMISFVSTILFWLDLDPLNVAVIMFYEDNASYLCLITSLLLALEHFTRRHARADGEVLQAGFERPDVDEVLRYIDRSLYCKQNLSAYQRSPTSYKLNCVEPFMVVPQLWPVTARRCLRDFQSLLAQYPAQEVLPLKAYELRSISVTNFVGPVDGLSVEVYHVFTTQLTDGKLREAAKRKRIEQRRDRKRRARTHRPGEIASTYSFLSLARTLDTPGRASIGSRSTHKRDRSGSVPCPSMASSRSRAIPHADQEDDLLWEAVERSIYFRKECPSAEKPDILFNVLGGFKHHSKPKPEWDDISTVLVPTTESKRVRVESTTQTEGACSATFNFKLPAPRARRRSKGAVETEVDVVTVPPSVCGDLVLVIRQKTPQQEETLRQWNSHSTKPSSDVHTDRKPAALVAIHTFHTSFIRDGSLQLSADDFDFFKVVENRLVAACGSRSGLQVEVAMSGITESRPEVSESPPDDLDSCQPHSASDEEVAGGIATSFPTCPRISPTRTTVPTLDMSRVAGASPANSARKKLPFYYKLVGGRRADPAAGLASPASSPRLSELTNRSRKWPTLLSRTARSAKDELNSATQVTLLPAQWWLEFCLWRVTHAPLLTAPDRDLEEFCFRHIVEVDPVKLMEWPEENGLDQLEALCCMKLSEHVLNAIVYAQQHFSLCVEDSPSDSPRGSASEATTLFDDPLVMRKNRNKTKRANKATALISKMKFKSMLFTVPARTEPKKKSVPSPRAASLPQSTQWPRSESLQTEPCAVDRLVKVAQPDAHGNDGLSSPSSFARSTSPDTDTPPVQSARRASLPNLPLRKAARFTMSKPAVLTIPPEVVVERVSAPPVETQPPAVHPAAAALTAAFAAKKSSSMRRTMEPAVSTAKAKSKAPAKKKAPPPPPGGGGGLAALFAKKAADATAASAPKGKAPLGRRLFWKPLENHADTVFDELANDNGDNPSFDVDPSTMSKVFVKSVKKTPLKPNRGEGDTKTYVTIMDAKRAQNVGIVVLRLRLPAEIVAGNLRSLTPDPRLSTDDLQKLQGIIFTPEEDQEVSKFLKNGGDPNELREVPERKLLPLRNELVPRGQERCRILVFDHKWRNWGSELSASLEVLERASQEMRQSKTFRQVLSVVLKWGNFVNYGSMPELQIKAITLSSLLKLTEFKTTIDASVTSLHYILANMLASAPEINLQGMSAEMSTVKAAAKIGGETLESVWRELNEGAKLLRSEKTEAEASYKSDDGQDLGYARLDEMLTNVEVELSRLEIQAQRTLTLVLSTARFFGDDSVPNAAVSGGKGINFAFGSVFCTFHSFLRKFDEAISDIGRRPQVYSKVVPEENIEALLSFCERISAKPKRPTSTSPPKAITPHTQTPLPIKTPGPSMSPPRVTHTPRKIGDPPRSARSSPSLATTEPRPTKSLRVTIGTPRSEMKLEPKSPPARVRNTDEALSRSDAGFLGRTVTVRRSMPDNSVSAPPVELGPSLKNLYNIR